MAQLALFDIAKVEIKLWKKKWRNYCFSTIICYGEKRFFRGSFFRHTIYLY